MDLGANEITTFRKVTFPLILPGVMAAALLAFSLSIDDFVITNFTSGGTVTFPMFIYAKARIGIPPQVNVVGTIIFLTAVGLVAASTIVSAPADDARRGRWPARHQRGRSTHDDRDDRSDDRRPPCPTTPSSRRSGAGSRTSTSTAARARG